MSVIVCEVCGKPLRFEAVSEGGHHQEQMEAVPCPYGAHSASARMSVGWWQSFTMSPDEQEAWLAANSPGPTALPPL